MMMSANAPTRSCVKSSAARHTTVCRSHRNRTADFTNSRALIRGRSGRLTLLSYACDESVPEPGSRLR
jgi:hypothetical protein